MDITIYRIVPEDVFLSSCTYLFIRYLGTNDSYYDGWLYANKRMTTYRHLDSGNKYEF